MGFSQSPCFFDPEMKALSHMSPVQALEDNENLTQDEKNEIEQKFNDLHQLYSNAKEFFWKDPQKCMALVESLIPEEKELANKNHPTNFKNMVYVLSLIRDEVQASLKNRSITLM